jgi:hypothetical protein
MCRSLKANDVEGRFNFGSSNHRSITAVLAPAMLPAGHVNERCAAGPGGRAGRLLRPERLRGAGSPDRIPMDPAFTAYRADSKADIGLSIG